MQRAWDAMPEWFEVLPAGAVCGAADDHRSQGVLLPTRW